MKGRKVILILIVLMILASLGYFYFGIKKTRMRSSLAPAFELVGKSTSSVNTVLTKVLPIDQWDEKRFGDAIRTRYLQYQDTTDDRFIYVNRLLGELTVFSQKDFEYTCFISSGSHLNAFALPGGVIFVTQGLLDSLESEAELVSILGHEVGHIEKGHCFKAVKFRLLASKLRMQTLGEVADFCFNYLTRTSFSKTQESEADDFGFKMLVNGPYDPSSSYSAFEQLYARYGQVGADSSQRANLLYDYYLSHPPLPLRIEKYRHEALHWWGENESEQRYVGRWNLGNRVTFFDKPRDFEWTGEASLHERSH